MTGVGKNIKKARKAAGLTQAELAKLTQLSRSHIGAIEIDSYNPSLATLNLIAKVLRTTTSALLASDDKKSVSKTLDREEELVDTYRSLNNEGQNILFSVLKSLSNSYPAVTNAAM